MVNFVIITPAHNEQALIEKTILSMVAQTMRPFRWIIVNDASTDRTVEVVQRYTVSFPFIHLLHLEREKGHSFASKAIAFNRGFTEVKGQAFDFIGNLDADISMPSNYFEQIFAEFRQNPRLGLAGGIVFSRTGGTFVKQSIASDSVAGAVQMFRRQCFDQIGGYQSLPYGGIDSVAEITARMNHWEVRTFPDIKVFEHRQTGTAAATPLRAKFREGKRFYSLGYAPFFYLLRLLVHLNESPMVISSFYALIGYIVAAAQRTPVATSKEFCNFLRMEQRMKLRTKLLGLLSKPAAPVPDTRLRGLT